jgi:hypothetical protein
MGTDEGRGWVGKSGRGSDLKDAGYGSFNRNPPQIAISYSGGSQSYISAPQDRAAPLAAAVLLVYGVELNPPICALVHLMNISRRRASAMP